MEIDKFLDENPPPSAENQQTLTELADTTENMWAKQNALFAYNRVMEISERFSYHSQILENMVAARQRGGGKQQSPGTSLPSVPAKSGSAADSDVDEGRESMDEEEDVNGGSYVDGGIGMVSHGSRLSPDPYDSDERTDAAAGRSLRYLSPPLFMILVVVLLPVGLYNMLPLTLIDRSEHTRRSRPIGVNYT